MCHINNCDMISDVIHGDDVEKKLQIRRSPIFLCIHHVVGAVSLQRIVFPNLEVGWASISHGTQ